MLRLMNTQLGQRLSPPLWLSVFLVTHFETRQEGRWRRDKALESDILTSCLYPWPVGTTLDKGPIREPVFLIGKITIIGILVGEGRSGH